MMASESGLDGTLHPALNTQDPRIEIVMETNTWREVEQEDAFSL